METVLCEFCDSTIPMIDLGGIGKDLHFHRPQGDGVREVHLYQCRECMAVSLY